ncbi:MAG: anaerobic ribonucleoside-triphosphate reductase activating protein, partial [Lentisphaerota bacterium]
IKLDTNGGRPDVLRQLIPLVDYIAMDVKCSLARYTELTDFKAPELVQESVNLIREKARDYHFRTTVIESFHTDDEMRALGRVIQGARRYVLQPFVPREDVLNESIRNLPRTTQERLMVLGRLMKPFSESVEVLGQ